MDIKLIDPLNIIVIEDVFTEKQQEDILEELSMYVNNGLLLEPEHTGSAEYSDGILKKKNSALFLDTVYGTEARSESSIIVHTENVLLSIEMIEALQDKNILYGVIKSANKHFTLVNYYEDSDYYDYHFDICAFSILSFFYKEPKSFSGGNLKFRVRDEETEIEIKNNMSVIFPSFYEHRVTPISMQESSSSEPLGRFSIAQFIFIVN